jgi:AraC-like DNA-binding protein
MVPVTVRGEVDARFGYTLDHLHHLTRRAVNGSLRTAMDYHDRLEVAWHAIVEHLYAATEAPSSLELIKAGNLAIEAMVREEYRTHGYARRSSYAGPHSSPQFQRFWWFATQHAPSPEPGVVDRVALWQIWPQLTSTHQQVLLALATHGDYQAAARSLGKTEATFKVQVSKARRAFLRLWHDGETPSRIWGTDRRVGRRDQPPADRRRRPATAAVARRRPMKRPQRPVVHNRHRYNNHGCHCQVCTADLREYARQRRRQAGIPERRRLTDAEVLGVLRRQAAGESLRAIATDLGVSDSCLSRRTRHATGTTPAVLPDQDVAAAPDGAAAGSGTGLGKGLAA